MQVQRRKMHREWATSLNLTLEAQASQGPEMLGTACRHADWSAPQPAHRAPPTNAACPCRHSHHCMPWKQHSTPPSTHHLSY